MVVHTFVLTQAIPICFVLSEMLFLGLVLNVSFLALVMGMSGLGLE